MDLLTFLDQQVKNARAISFANSNQWTIGELIEALQEVGTEYGDEKQNKTISFDFGSALPTQLDCWRGSYSELALGYVLSGHDGDGDYENTTVEKLLKELVGAIGKTFTGWKGGDFIMDKNTPIWVSNPGNSDNTGVTGILDLEYKVVILTGYCEY